jgi:hypothetical protein
MSKMLSYGTLQYLNLNSAGEEVQPAPTMHIPLRHAAITSDSSISNASLAQVMQHRIFLYNNWDITISFSLLYNEPITSRPIKTYTLPFHIYGSIVLTLYNYSLELIKINSPYISLQETKH